MRALRAKGRLNAVASVSLMCSCVFMCVFSCCALSAPLAFTARGLNDMLARYFAAATTTRPLVFLALNRFPFMSIVYFSPFLAAGYFFALYGHKFVSSLCKHI